MPKASFDPDKPTSAGGVSTSDLKNNFQALYQLDLNVLRPRAKVPTSMAIGICGTLTENYYDNVYFVSGDDWATRMSYASGDYTFSIPSANPRIDILGLNRSNQIVIASGTEGASPVVPAISGDIIPICEVYHKTTETKIVNYEDRGSYPNEGYIKKDIRPFLYQKIYGGDSGNVIGPASATDGHLAVFNGATGKTIKDGGAIGASDYDSGWFAVGTATKYTKAHSLGVRPSRVKIMYRKLAGSTIYFEIQGYWTSEYGACLGYDTTNIYVRTAGAQVNPYPSVTIDAVDGANSATGFYRILAWK